MVFLLASFVLGISAVASVLVCLVMKMVRGGVPKPVMVPMIVLVGTVLLDGRFIAWGSAIS